MKAMKTSKTKMLGLVAMGLFAGPMTANAAVTTFDAQGTFEGDDGTLSGTLTMNIVSSPFQICAPDSINLVTTDGFNLGFAGQSYNSFTSSACDQLVLSNAAGATLRLFF